MYRCFCRGVGFTGVSMIYGDVWRTAAAWMGDVGTGPHVIEAALNHAAIHSQLPAAYNRSRYSPEVGRALQRWADEMDRIAVVNDWSDR